MSNIHQKYILYHTEGKEESIKKWLKPYANMFKRCKKVLDIGCGPGVFLELLKENGIESIGIDIDPLMVEICLEKGLKAQVGEAHIVEKYKEEFDGIHLGHIIEHMDGPNMLRLLEACVKALKKGGLLLIRTPNWLNETVRKIGFWLDPTHVRPYPLELLERIYSDLGLTIITKGYESFGWNDIYILGKKSNGILSIYWEGSQFVYHSLALINREICLQLIKKGYKVSIIPYEKHQFGSEMDKRFKAIEERINKPLSKPADIHIRHHWPPNFNPPPEGHWVIIQPWEFGPLPKDWIEPMRDLVDEIWVPSKYVWKSYVSSGIPPEKVFVIPNGVNIDIFNPKAKPYPLKTKKHFKFLFVGGSIWRKGIDILLEAYTEIFTNKDDVTLVIKDMGQDSFYKHMSLKGKIEEIKNNPDAPEILYLTDKLTERQMAGLYTACDCLVHPYRGEGFGLPVLEAMACGIPVVVTEGGAMDDFCKKQWAYLIPSNRILIDFPDCKLVRKYAEILEPNKEKIKSILKHVFRNYGEAQEKARHALEYVQRYFNWKVIGEKVIQRIEELRKKPIRRYVFKMKSKKSREELYKEAEFLYKNGQEDKAIALFQKALALDPSFALAHNNLAFIYWQKQDVEKALHHIIKAMEISPDNRDIIWNCGQIMLGLGYAKDAYKVYKSYLKRHPEEKEIKQVVEELEKGQIF